jgi:predicted glycoside hydrolase/deacetylase ChbG (UPF0249 family)
MFLIVAIADDYTLAPSVRKGVISLGMEVVCIDKMHV